MLAWAYIVLLVLGVFSAVDAVMSNRTATGAIGWPLGPVAVPVVALPAYWVFGRTKFEGYLEARRENQEEIDANLESSVVHFRALKICLAPTRRTEIDIAT